MKDEITLREWEPSDGAAINRLGEQTADTGAVGFYTQFRYDAYEVMNALQPDMTGVVAEAVGHEGLVGMGLVTFVERQYEGEVRPSAYEQPERAPRIPAAGHRVAAGSVEG